MNVTNAIGGSIGLALWGAGTGAAGAAAAKGDPEMRPTMVALTAIAAGSAAMGIGLTPDPFASAAAKARIYGLCAIPLAAGAAAGALVATRLLDS